MSARAVLLALALAAVAACRDAPEPFVAPSPGEPTGSEWRLTFNAGDDRAPRWTPDGRHVVYRAEGFATDPESPGVLVRIPFEGGAAEEALRNVQGGASGTRWLTTPAVSPAGDRVAFGHVLFLHGESLCGAAFVDCDGVISDPKPVPRLGRVALRARRFDATGSLSDDPALELEFEGRHFDGTRQLFGLPGAWVIDYYPFHRAYVEEGTLVFRPTWAPDGDRVAFSDGLRIHVWAPGADTTVAVPGTDDGVSAAWSPDGEWIAFTRLERVAADSCQCAHYVFGSDGSLLTCAEDRVEYSVGRHVVTLVRPDGTGAMEVGDGDEPAWAPDAGALFFRRDDRIWRHDLAAGTEAPVPGTDGGREPAASPDGRHLAFARLGPDEQYDLWIVALEP